MFGQVGRNTVDYFTKDDIDPTAAAKEVILAQLKGEAEVANKITNAAIQIGISDYQSVQQEAAAIRAEDRADTRAQAAEDRALEDYGTQLGIEDKFAQKKETRAEKLADKRLLEEAGITVGSVAVPDLMDNPAFAAFSTGRAGILRGGGMIFGPKIGNAEDAVMQQVKAVTDGYSNAQDSFQRMLMKKEVLGDNAAFDIAANGIMKDINLLKSNKEQIKNFSSAGQRQMKDELIMIDNTIKELEGYFKQLTD
tara:strand:+ start:6885 stop:7640 length:756 start_codon:yes stop_codon:yes gene_type:complete